MNFNFSIKCDTCQVQTNCRLGLSNRPVQPLRFRCKDCGAPIDITMTLDFETAGIDIQIAGATEIACDRFTPEVNFVDLHLDFPVSFEPYEMGLTPFMRAVERVGYESIRIHAMRVQYLNEVHEVSKEIKAIFTLYANEKYELFREKVMAFLGTDMPCETQLDRNRALYYAIEKAFFPFSEPPKNVGAVDTIIEELMGLEQKDAGTLASFINQGNRI